MNQEVSLTELANFAPDFWKVVNGASVFALHGEMGAGKTTLIKALCAYKGVTGSVSSPTFSIINEYSYTEKGFEKVLYHIDLYRLRDDEELEQAGVTDCVDSGALCFVEWPEKAPWLFDEAAVHVFVEPVSSTKRRIKIQPLGNTMQ